MLYRRLRRVQLLPLSGWQTTLKRCLLNGTASTPRELAKHNRTDPAVRWIAEGCHGQGRVLHVSQLSRIGSSVPYPKPHPEGNRTHSLMDNLVDFGTYFNEANCTP